MDQYLVNSWNIDSDSHRQRFGCQRLPQQNEGFRFRLHDDRYRICFAPSSPGYLASLSVGGIAHLNCAVTLALVMAGVTPVSQFRVWPSGGQACLRAAPSWCGPPMRNSGRRLAGWADEAGMHVHNPGDSQPSTQLLDRSDCHLRPLRGWFRVWCQGRLGDWLAGWFWSLLLGHFDLADWSAFWRSYRVVHESKPRPRSPHGLCRPSNSEQGQLQLELWPFGSDFWPVGRCCYWLGNLQGDRYSVNNHCGAPRGAAIL